MHIVWFKRDLRINDHAALDAATKLGDILPLFILEPKAWSEPDMGHRHYMFMQSCIQSLDKELTKLGQNLIVKVGDAVDVLHDLNHRHNISSLWSNQETWNGWSYARDKRVGKWCESNQILWQQPAQNGVIRRLNNRNGWASRWHYHMKKTTLKPPSVLASIDEESEELLSPSSLGLEEDHCIDPQKGGREEGLNLLQSFLYDRGEGYTKEMSSPLTAYDSCSRLSTHIAFGTLSVREIYQAYEKRNYEIKQMPPGTKGKWPGALRSFSGRLRWHCHFIQKLEDEPSIEFKNMHPAYDNLREPFFNDEYFNAWKSGQTGFPMVDACMRALTATGWLNFRMRAMVMSFASYHLWLHWRAPALHLATLFTDYEPGIHYSQVQMQSGTTGINAIRIYNPIKQSMDQDMEGTFIRRWVPELRHIEATYIHTPWELPSAMNGYPMPIVDEKKARKAAADKLYGLRRGNRFHKQTAQQIVKKHASRRSPHPKKSIKSIQQSRQGELPL